MLLKLWEIEYRILRCRPTILADTCGESDTAKNYPLHDVSPPGQIVIKKVDS
jgi:hypothetical protein